jgi:hypothetical protein
MSPTCPLIGLMDYSKNIWALAIAKETVVIDLMDNTLKTFGWEWAASCMLDLKHLKFRALI